MMKEDFAVKHLLRQQAWERAKGELQAVMVTYIAEQEKFDAMYEAVTAFVMKVEDDGLAE